MNVENITPDAYEATLRYLDAGTRVADMLQDSLVRILEDCEKRPMKDIVGDSRLVAIFAHEWKGLDRTSAVKWFENFSPLRVRFEKDGKFKDISANKGKIKEYKDAGRPVWDTAGAKLIHWAQFAPERTRQAKAGTVDKALALAVSQLARAAFEAGSVGKVIEEFHRLVETKLGEDLGNYMRDSKTFAEWKIAREDALRNTVH